ncbi:BQ5605_C015g07787 [Microbotryum silenes-dioicae]|uniref:BQ5605_C015g07787 protein n=1 Tax=Microbotryum silenes-dioicae TaxID=796604 RepID=A0A2X0LXJ0_9BASI|nr:BQ5605_C015g07787 [Microbotryum silenes-dioicae]
MTTTALTAQDDHEHDHEHDHPNEEDQFKVVDTASQVDRHVQQLKTLSKQLLLDENPPTPARGRRECIDHIATILEEYQLEPFLLDAHLVAILAPYLDHLCEVVLSGSNKRDLTSIESTCHVLYLFAKLRGPKAIGGSLGWLEQRRQAARRSSFLIFPPHPPPWTADADPYFFAFSPQLRKPNNTLVPLFPPTPQALSSLLSLLDPLSKDLGTKPISTASPSNDPASEPVPLAWTTCYVLLLWLSVSTRLPFPLPTRTSDSIKAIGLRYLQVGKGKEKEGGRLVLRAWYTRKDAPIEELVTLTTETLEKPSTELLLASSILSSLLEILKQPSMKQNSVLLSPNNRSRLYALVQLCRAFGNKRDELRKERVKLMGRLVVLELSSSAQNGEESEGQDDTEEIIGDLMQTLENKQSNLRYSAAKYLARICGLLSSRISSDILDSILDQFEQCLRHDQDPDQVEARLQGSLLTFAEMGRRGVFGMLAEATSEVALEVRLMIQRILRGVIRCLTFDHLSSKRSFGTQVRDSASYVVWSLARSLDPRLIDIELGQQLGKVLVCVALFDKEVGVRRASSAAFQEGVGRWSIFVDGIDILRKIDFFTISVRRRAFTEAAPLVAENPAYRSALIDHLMAHSFPHYEFGLQSLASQALKAIISIDARELAPPLLTAQIERLGKTKDPAKLHGILMSLNGLGLAARASIEDPLVDALDQIYASLISLPPTLRAFRTPQVLIALYKALASSLNPRTQSIRPPSPREWQDLLALASDSPSDEVHLASARFYTAFTRSSNDGDEEDAHLENIVKALGDRKQTKQVWAAKVLGSWTFATKRTSDIPNGVVKRLIGFVGSEGKSKAGSIEAKRNGVEALARIVCSDVSLDSTLISEAYLSILAAFQDYTVDHRGDVGSWVRLSAIQATSICLNTAAARDGSPTMDQQTFDRFVASLLKQAVERLDNVRLAAGTVLLKVAEGVNSGRLKDKEVFEAIASDRREWRDLAWSSEKLLPLLSVPEYRALLLEGSVMAFTRHSSSTPLIDFAATLPSLRDDPPTPEYTFEALIEGLVDLGRQHITSNRLFVPVVDALASIVETGFVDEESEPVASLLKFALDLASRSLPKIKTAARLTAMTKFVVALLSFETFRAQAVDQVGVLLSHPSAPWVSRYPCSDYCISNRSMNSSETENILVSPTQVRQLAADEILDQISSETLLLPTDEHSELLQEVLLQTSWSQGEIKEEHVGVVIRLLTGRGA